MNDKTEQDNVSARPAKPRSPNHPAFALPEVLEKARIIFDKARTAPVPAQVVCTYLDVSPTSSTGMRWLATLQEFGLLTAEGRGTEKLLRVSESGRVLLKHPDRGSEEYRNALREAALAPKMHQRVWALREDGHLPPDEALLYTLSGPEWGFTEAAAEAFVTQFRQTIVFAGLTGPVTDQETGDGGNSNPPPPGNDAAKPPGGHTKPKTEHTWMPTTTETSKIIPIPLQSGGTATLTLPYPLDEADYTWMSGLLGGLKRSMMATPSLGEAKPQREEEAP